MVSVAGNEPFLSLEPKGGTFTAEEELDHYRRRFQSMKLVLKELQQQVVLYKTRCTGVDTVALMLKESKQEVMKLIKQRKALEIAVANLQNRLSANGLSDSVNIEETEMFVPGASKQTLDNLARENARLRSLLKSQEGQSGMKSSEELQGLRVSLENIEAENKQLRVQMLELESVKQILASQFEEAITTLKKEHQVEKLILEQKLCVQRMTLNSQPNEIDSDVEGRSKATQTGEVELSKIDEIRQVLKLVCDQCVALDLSLEHAHIAAQHEREKKSQVLDQTDVITEEAHMELQKKLNQVIQMNQRWQAYNHSQEQQVHGLLARVTELEQVVLEGENLKTVVNTKEIENKNLRKEIENLTREANKFWSQPQFDVSIVEILKQQIQVCTEDFNTERKDREHAVNRSKQLQDEVNKLTFENDNLRKDIDNMRRIKNTPEHDKRESQLWTKPQYQYTARGGLPAQLHQRIPYSLFPSSGASPSSAALSLSPVPSPAPSFMSASSATDRSSFYPPSSQDSMIGFQSPARVAGNMRQSSHAGDSISRIPREDSPSPSSFQKPRAANLSMPALSKKSEGQEKIKNRQTDLTCPRCSQEFTEDQQNELINHINTCSD